MNIKLNVFLVLVFLLSISAHADNSLEKILNSVVVKGQVPLKLYVLDCGHVKANNAEFFNPLFKKGTKKDLANACYLIKHPKGTLLWDTGLSDELIKSKKGMSVLGGAFHMTVKKTLESQLREVGILPTGLDYVAFSHLHNDHTGNAKLFSKSKWLIQEAEYSMAFGVDAKKYGHHPEDYVSAGASVQKLNGHMDVFGDGSVVLIPTPGHSPGHQSLYVDLPKTGPIIIAGDLYHFKENRDDYAIPVWNSKKETIHSFAVIDLLLDKNMATLWIQHDKSLFDSQKHAPEFYQ